MADFYRIRYPTNNTPCHRYYGDPIAPPLAPYFCNRKDSLNEAMSEPLSEVTIDNHTSSTSSGNRSAGRGGDVDALGMFL